MIPDRGRRRLHGDAQLRAHASRELTEREGLDQVVDGAGVETSDPVLDAAQHWTNVSRAGIHFVRGSTNELHWQARAAAP